jgi:hypothetical protein
MYDSGVLMNITQWGLIIIIIIIIIINAASLHKHTTVDFTT